MNSKLKDSALIGRVYMDSIIGALGTVPKDLIENIRQSDFNKKESNDIIRAIQQRHGHRHG